MTFLVTFLGIAFLANVIGNWVGHLELGRRIGSHPLTALALLLSIFLWFVAAWVARPYADTDQPGWQVAEWFAHAGKWWTLLAGGLFFHGVIMGANLIPRTIRHRLLYHGAVLLTVGLVGLRTMPVYFFLGEGKRDRNGYLIQSVGFESTCAGVALVNYLERHHNASNLTERAVSRLCGTTQEGTTTTALLRAARVLGLTNASARCLRLEELAQHGPPVIISISTIPSVRHATLLEKIDSQQCHFIDPAYGLWSVSRERFLQIWYGKAVLLD